MSAELEAIRAEEAADLGAAAAEQQQAGQGAPEVEAIPMDSEADWVQAVHDACELVFATMPELEAEWGPDRRERLGVALARCAERYGWTILGILGHPLVGLAFAMFPMLRSLVKVAKARAERMQAAAQAQAEAQAAKQAAQQ
jgi:hypothetical protein